MKIYYFGVIIIPLPSARVHFSVVFEKDNGSLLAFNLLLIAFSYEIGNISLYLHDKCPLSTAVLIVAIGLLYTRI